MRSLTGPKVRNPPVGKSWTPCWGIPRRADEPSPGSWCSTCLRRRTGCQWCPGVATESGMQWWNRITAGYTHTVFFFRTFQVGESHKDQWCVCFNLQKECKNIWVFIKGDPQSATCSRPGCGSVCYLHFVVITVWQRCATACDTRKQRLLSTLLVGFILTSRRYILSHCGPLKVRIIIAYEATAAVSLLIGWYEAALIKGQKPPVRI